MKEVSYKRTFPDKIYRSIRKGLMILPDMEKRLIFDMRRLLMLASMENLTDLEMTYATQAIQTVQEVVDETVNSLKALIDFLAPHILKDVSRLEQTLVEFMPDFSSEMRSEFMQLVRDYGSVGAIFDSALDRLEFKRDVLSTSLQQIQKGNKAHLELAVRNMEEAYMEKKNERFPVVEGSIESIDDLVSKWQKLLDDAKKEIENAKSFWEREDAKDKYFSLLELLCHKYPHVAKAMGMLSEPLGEGLQMPPIGEKVCDRLYRHDIICMLFCGPLFCLIVIVIAIMCSRDCQG
jgi:uncharacterized protein YukE